MKLACWLVDVVSTNGAREGSRGAVETVVQQVLDEHRSEDKPMVHAFATALASNGTAGSG
jgi:hypothetical protein